MITEEIKELQKMLEESRESLEKDIALASDLDEDLEETLEAIKRAEIALQDPSSHQLVSDLFTAFCYLDANVYDELEECDFEDCEECDEEDEE